MSVDREVGGADWSDRADALHEELAEAKAELADWLTAVETLLDPADPEVTRHDVAHAVMWVGQQKRKRKHG